MKRPWDKTVLGTKQSLDKTSSANLRQNILIFRDGLSVLENKTLFRTKRPWPTKNAHFDFSHICYCARSVVPVYNTLRTFFFAAPAPLLLPWQPDPAAQSQRCGPGGPAPSGTGKCSEPLTFFFNQKCHFRKKRLKIKKNVFSILILEFFPQFKTIRSMSKFQNLLALLYNLNYYRTGISAIV
jgi:hypothetical protein